MSRRVLIDTSLQQLEQPHQSPPRAETQFHVVQVRRLSCVPDLDALYLKSVHGEIQCRHRIRTIAVNCFFVDRDLPFDVCVKYVCGSNDKFSRIPEGPEDEHYKCPDALPDWNFEHQRSTWSRLQNCICISKVCKSRNSQPYAIVCKMGWSMIVNMFRAKPNLLTSEMRTITCTNNSLQFGKTCLRRTV